MRKLVVLFFLLFLPISLSLGQVDFDVVDIQTSITQVPGTSHQYLVKVKNIGSDANFTLIMGGGIPFDWCSIGNPKHIQKGQTDTLNYTLNLPRNATNRTFSLIVSAATENATLLKFYNITLTVMAKKPSFIFTIFRRVSNFFGPISNYTAKVSYILVYGKRLPEIAKRPMGKYAIFVAGILIALVFIRLANTLRKPERRMFKKEMQAELLGELKRKIKKAVKKGG